MFAVFLCLLVVNLHSWASRASGCFQGPRRGIYTEIDPSYIDTVGEVNVPDAIPKTRACRPAVSCNLVSS